MGQSGVIQEKNDQGNNINDGDREKERTYARGTLQRGQNLVKVKDINV